MSIPKKTHELIRQNERIVRKSQKHDANLQKNSTLYFQIGLIVCLLAAYGLLEMKFEINIPNYAVKTPMDPDVYIDIPIIKDKVPEPVEPIVQKKSKLPEDFEIVDDDVPVNPIVDNIKEPTIDVNPPIDPDDMIDIVAPTLDYNIMGVEQVPIYPGCEKKKTNDERRKCMSDKLTKLIQRKFNTGLGEDLGLSGRQVIQTQFKIDKTGRVIDIKTRSVHDELKNEAERVINKIPEMIPGKQSNKSVGVIYTLPIVFFVQN